MGRRPCLEGRRQGVRHRRLERRRGSGRHLQMLRHRLRHFEGAAGLQAGALSGVARHEMDPAPDRARAWTTRRCRTIVRESHRLVALKLTEAGPQGDRAGSRHSLSARCADRCAPSKGRHRAAIFMPGSCWRYQRLGGLGSDSRWRAPSACGFRPEIVLGKYRQQGTRHSGAARPGFAAVDAAASTGPDNASPRRARERRRLPAETPLRLAQSGDVEIYIDEYGRRVIVDAFTGEVLGIQRPRQNRDYRRQRRLRELNRDQGGFSARRSGCRHSLRAAALLPGPRRSRNIRKRPDEAFPDAPEEAYPGRAGRISRGAAAARRDARADRAPAARRRHGRAEGAGARFRRRRREGSKEPGVVFAGREEVAGLQVLLDRKGASPGVIDGHFGSNVDKALAAYRDITGQNLHSTDTEAIKKALAADAAATRSRPTRSRRRMRPGRSSPRCRPTTATRPSSTG